jgi:hypothetical protein
MLHHGQETKSRSRPVLKLGLGAGAAGDGVFAPVLPFWWPAIPASPAAPCSVTPVPRHVCLHSAGKRSTDRSQQLLTLHLTIATPFHSITRAPRGRSVLHSLLRTFRCNAYSTRVCADRWVFGCELPSSLSRSLSYLRAAACHSMASNMTKQDIHHCERSSTTSPSSSPSANQHLGHYRYASPSKGFPKLHYRCEHHPAQAVLVQW